MIPDRRETALIFTSSPRTLQEMACSQCALLYVRLTYSHHFNLYPDETSDADWFVACKCYINVNALHLPKCIKEIIDGQMESIGPMLYRWALNSFGKNCRDNISNCLGDIVLKQNGEICYKTTAKNLLKNDTLNMVEKYRIACWYGFEEEVERLWPLVRDDARVDDCDFSRQPSMFYWNCRMRKELDKIPGDERDSPEWRMILSDGLHFWSEIEYFWSKLSQTEQNLQIIKVPAGLGFISKHLMPMLSQSQLSHILKLVPCAMVVDLAVEGETMEYAWQTWNHVKGSISNEQFYEILYRLWNFTFNERQTGANRVAGFLHEIWISAEQNQKMYVLNNDVQLFFNNLDNDRIVESYGCNMSFLLDVFANLTVERRKEIWTENWRKFVILAKASDLGKFMELCFDNEDCIVDFKQNAMMDYVMLDYEFNSFVRRGLCDELVEYLEFCSSDQTLVQPLRIRIIESNIRIVFYYFEAKTFAKFNDFIDGSFPSIDRASEFKETFVLQNINIWYDILENGCLIDVKSAFECLSFRQRFLILVKRMLLEHWQCILSFGSFTRFSIRESDEFLGWCCSGQEEIIRMKNSIDVDDVLEALLPKLIRDEMFSPPYFSPLDSFLRWYFVTEYETKRYKSSRIGNFRFYDDDVVGRVLKGGDRREIQIMLRWFFDNDLTAAGKFQLDTVEY